MGNTEVTSRASVNETRLVDQQSNQDESTSQAPLGGRINLKVTQGSMESLSQAEKQSTTNYDQRINDSVTVGAAAELMRRREELEAQEARRNKNDFIYFCEDVLTSHKQQGSNKDEPDRRQKHRVLQKVVNDQKTLLQDGDREPTVDEYGQFIKQEMQDLRDRDNQTPATNSS